MLIRIRQRIYQEMKNWTVILFETRRASIGGTPERQPRRHCAEANESPGIIAFKIRLRHLFSDARRLVGNFIKGFNWLYIRLGEIWVCVARNKSRLDWKSTLVPLAVYLGASTLCLPSLAFNAALKSPPCNPLDASSEFLRDVAHQESSNLINVTHVWLDSRKFLRNGCRRVIELSERPPTFQTPGITERDENSTWNDSTEGSSIINTLRKCDSRCEITVSPFLHPPVEKRRHVYASYRGGR